jgi:hypothetical protein
LRARFRVGRTATPWAKFRDGGRRSWGKPPFARGGRRSLFRDSGLAQAIEDGFKLGQIRRVVARRRPGCAGARNRERRVEREADLDCKMRLVKAAKLREGVGQPEMR